MNLHNLTIEKYRSFDHFKLDGLTRINLLVGENNSGKTSVLEAGYLLASPDPYGAIGVITRMRGETCLLKQRLHNPESSIVPTVDCLFYDRSIDLNSLIRITGDANNSGQTSTAEFEASVRSWESATPSTDPPHPNFLSPEEWRLEMNWKFGEFATVRKVWMTKDGALVVNEFAGNDVYESAPKSVKQVAHNSEFITLAAWDAIELARRWDRVLRSGNKSVVVRCLDILHGGIQDVLFLPGQFGASQRLSGVLLQLEGTERPVPLTSMGDGSQRLLMIATALSSCVDGVLFIDEIDAGLHYSKLPDVWRMLIKAAVENDVQIMAATHSQDCIRALATVCDDDESLREEVALFSVDRRMDEAVRYGGEELSTVVNHEIEVR